MPRLMMMGGSLPSKEELLTDDLVIQMVAEAKEEGKGGSVTKEAVIQALTAEEVPEAIRTVIQKAAPTKESVIQSLKPEDAVNLPFEVRQKVLDDAKVVPAVAPEIKAIAEAVSQAASGRGAVTDEGAKSTLQALRESA